MWQETDVSIQSSQVGCRGMSGPDPDTVRLPKMTHCAWRGDLWTFVTDDAPLGVLTSGVEWSSATITSATTELGITLRANLVISALKRSHVVYNKPRLRCVMTVMRMMHSEIDSPRSRTFCSRRHVSSSIGICQLPFGNRRAVSCMSNSNTIRARHSSLISISGIGLAESRRDGRPWSHMGLTKARSAS